MLLEDGYANWHRVPAGIQFMGMKWVDRMMELSRHVSTWSRDPSTKVGAVVVDVMSKKVLGMGFNGFPRGVNDLQERYDDRPTKYKMVVHAEVNALLNANGPVQGCALFCTYPPCSECCKYVIQTGIVFIVCPPAIDPRWKESFETTRIMCEEAGVHIIFWDSAAYK